MNHRKRIYESFFATCCLVMLAISGCESKVDLDVKNESAVSSVPKQADEQPSAQATGASEAAIASPPEESRANQQETAANPRVRISDEAFRVAAHNGKIETVRSSIHAGKDVNVKDPRTSYTAMHMAAYNGHHEIVTLLLEHDAVVDCRDAEGKTPLIHACTGPFPKTVEILLEAGADINAAESTEGFTPLMMAAGIGETEVVKVLLRHGADKAIQDIDNDTALSHARNSGHTEIVSLLQQ